MRSMNKKMLLIIAGLIVLVGGCSEFHPVTPEPEIQPTVKLSLTEETVGAGEPSVLSIELKDIDDSVFGLSLRIVYDPLLVTIDEEIGFTMGDFLGTNALALFQVEAGVIHVAITDVSMGEKAMTSGSVGTVVIQGLSVGQCDFVIDSDELRFIDNQGDNLEVLDLEILDVSFSIQDQ